jgi:hypothetical protein
VSLSADENDRLSPFSAFRRLIGDLFQPFVTVDNEFIGKTTSVEDAIVLLFDSIGSDSKSDTDFKKQFPAVSQQLLLMFQRARDKLKTKPYSMQEAILRCEAEEARQNAGLSCFSFLLIVYVQRSLILFGFRCTSVGCTAYETPRLAEEQQINVASAVIYFSSNPTACSSQVSSLTLVLDSFDPVFIFLLCFFSGFAVNNMFATLDAHTRIAATIELMVSLWQTIASVDVIQPTTTPDSSSAEISEFDFARSRARSSSGNLVQFYSSILIASRFFDGIAFSFQSLYCLLC